MNYQLPCCTSPGNRAQIRTGGENPQEFGLISSAEKIPLNHVNPQRRQEMKSQKRLKVSRQNEMKGWRYSS